MRARSASIPGGLGLSDDSARSDTRFMRRCGRGSWFRPALRCVYDKVKLGRHRGCALSCRYVVADGAEGAQPLPGTRTAPVGHHERVWSIGHEHVKDFGEGEQLSSYFMHPVVSVCDMNLVGLHAGSFRP
jgi:hypothetical protein